jgi:hypothetical protein
MGLKLTIGDLAIHSIIEQETTFLPALEMLPGLTPDLLAETGRGCGRRPRSMRRTC